MEVEVSTVAYGEAFPIVDGGLHRILNEVGSLTLIAVELGGSCEIAATWLAKTLKVELVERAHGIRVVNVAGDEEASYAQNGDRLATDIGEQCGQAGVEPGYLLFSGRLGEVQAGKAVAGVFVRLFQAD